MRSYRACWRPDQDHCDSPETGEWIATNGVSQPHTALGNTKVSVNPKKHGFLLLVEFRNSTSDLGMELAGRLKKTPEHRTYCYVLKLQG